MFLYTNTLHLFVYCININNILRFVELSLQREQSYQKSVLQVFLCSCLNKFVENVRTD